MTFVAILETRIIGEITKKVCSKIGRSNWIRVEAKGFSRAGVFGCFGIGMKLS